MSQTLKCGCGSAFTTSANLKKHQKLCKKTCESDDNSDAQSVHSDTTTTTTTTNKSQLDRMEAKIDLIMKHTKIDITSIATQAIVQQKEPKKIKVTSSKPKITFEELCIKDFATKKDAIKHTQYALLGCNGIVSLFKDILTKYPNPPFKYVNTPTKKSQKDAECVIHMFEDNIQIYKDKTWKPMTRDDTNDFFYNLYIALENNSPVCLEDNEEYDEELDKFYSEINDMNVYSMVVVNIKDELIEAIKTIC